MSGMPERLAKETLCGESDAKRNTDYVEIPLGRSIEIISSAIRQALDEAVKVASDAEIAIGYEPGYVFTVKDSVKAAKGMRDYIIIAIEALK